MNNLDGQILSALIAALLLAWIASWLIAHRYTRKMLSLMQWGAAPDNTLPSPAVITDSAVASATSLPSSANLLQQNQRARIRLRLCMLTLSIVMAGIVGYVSQAAYVETGFSWRRLLTLTVIFAWPLVPTLGLLERWPRSKIFMLALLYVLLSSGLVAINSTEQQNMPKVIFWLFSQQLPLLLVIFFITGPKLRSTGPYLIWVFFILMLSTLLGLAALEHNINKGPDSWILALSALTNVNTVFVAFSIVPWLIAYFPVRAVARWLADAYQRKAFSEPLYLAAGLWSITLLFQALILSHSLGGSAYALLLAILLFPLFLPLLRKVMQPKHQPPNLLLLRVFRGDDSIEALFDQVIERWRYSGNTLLIAGKDLALRNLEPDELFTFLKGRLQDRFIDSPQHLQQLLSSLDFKADPDGRYRINEFFCFDTTWKMVLASLVQQVDRVLMDLRGYTPDRAGCSHELQVLAANTQLKKLVILFDKHTHKASAEALLNDSPLKIHWVDSENAATSTASEVLRAILVDS
ncbi:MAG: hypothetical protein CTY19_06255 [Methylomonas sp.]|nr:MAG: hypothetical protein CTY19_06255 [Methylomonas sp.]